MDTVVEQSLLQCVIVFTLRVRFFCSFIKVLYFVCVKQLLNFVQFYWSEFYARKHKNSCNKTVCISGFALLSVIDNLCYFLTSVVPTHFNLTGQSRALPLRQLGFLVLFTKYWKIFYSFTGTLSDKFTINWSIRFHQTSNTSPHYLVKY